MLISRDYVIPFQIYSLGMYLRLLQYGGGFSISKGNARQKGYPQNFSHPHEILYRFLSHTLKKGPLRLKPTCHCSITVLRILIGRFSESTSVSLQFILAVFDPITFGFFIADISPYIMCTRAHLKDVKKKIHTVIHHGLLTTLRFD